MAIDATEGSLRADVARRYSPVDLEELGFTLWSEFLVQPIDDLLVRSALEGDGFALIVEA